MKKLADGLDLLDGFPPYAINVYLVGDVLVDAATRRAGKRILRQLEGRTITTHALTHAHPDHQGASHEVCEALGIPLWCGELDAEAMEDGRIMERQPKHPLNTLIGRVWPGPAHPVARRLREGDEVAGFQVLETPGHTAGHVAFWRESDRTLIAGDVLWNFQLAAGRPGLTQPLAPMNWDSAVNRASARRLAALEPALVCFGHGPAMRDTRRFTRVVEALPTP
jgi:hydroxyacylglutathione hydrolase